MSCQYFWPLLLPPSRVGLKSEDFFEFGLDDLLPFPTHQAQLGMQAGFFEAVEVIALADGWRAKPICAVEVHFAFERLASQGETGQAINEQLPQFITAFLAGHHDKPVIALKVGRPAL